MKTTIDMAREVYGAHTEWTGAPLDRLEQLVALVCANQREIDAAVWRGAVEAEREACAVIAETPISGEQDDLTMQAKDRVAAAIRARGTQ